MRYEESHLSDQDLAQAADGELAAARLAKVRAHLAACWPCRARMNEIEAAMISFVRLQREVLDARLPPIAGPRALLRARLAEAGDTIEGSTARGSFGSIFPRLPQPHTLVAAALVVAVLGIGLHAFITGSGSPERVEA